MSIRLSLLPFKGMEQTDIDNLIQDLRFLSLKVTVAEEMGIPAGAYTPQRRQYRADAFLDRARLKRGDRILAVTNLDLYSGTLNFVFGLAELPGKAAVISLYRLRMDADRATFRDRAVKEAVHELGHTFGLQHCTNPECVMVFSNSLEDTDRKNREFCGLCSKDWRKFATVNNSQKESEPGAKIFNENLEDCE